MNYAALTQAIQDYTQNSESTFVSNIPTFVQQAEQRIYNTVQFPSLRKNTTLTTAAGSQYVNCPDDFLAPYSMAVIDGTGNYTYLLNKDVNFLRQAYPSPSYTGLPLYYTLFGPQASATTKLRFSFGPTPDTIYSLDLNYFFYPTSIVTNGTSWLGDNLDSVLLYGSLVEAYTFMKGDQDMMALYDNKYKEALALAKRLGDGLERRDAYRSGQARVPVT